MFTTPRLRDSISVALTKLLQRGRRGSHYIQVCKKGSRQSEQQRSDIRLRNLAFCVWEDASLWARCIHSFLMHFSYLGQSCFLVHLAPCILPTPQQSPEEWGEWQHPLPSEEWGGGVGASSGSQFGEPSFTVGGQISLMAVTFLFINMAGDIFISQSKKHRPS